MNCNEHVGSRSHWAGILPGFTWTTLIISLGALPAVGQQATPLQQQIEDLKQEYQATNQALQLRIAALEQQVENQKVTAEKANQLRFQQQIWPLSMRPRRFLVTLSRLGGSFKAS